MHCLVCWYMDKKISHGLWISRNILIEHDGDSSDLTVYDDKYPEDLGRVSLTFNELTKLISKLTEWKNTIEKNKKDIKQCGSKQDS